jgi:septal ring factor EnvC (AmiA/AmiB activator)|tara:strand:- start:5374 stop:5568 length:195 start_codon:yes stop_codon:yes gene_type:complete
MNAKRKQEKLNALRGSIQHLDQQISSNESMIRSLERTVKRYQDSKDKINKQIEELETLNNDRNV